MLGNSPRGSASGAAGEKLQLPAGNAEPLEAPKVSTAHGFQPRAHPARSKCTPHSPVGLGKLAKITPKKETLLHELSELTAPISQQQTVSAFCCGLQKETSQGLHPARIPAWHIGLVTQENPLRALDLCLGFEECAIKISCF